MEDNKDKEIKRIRLLKIWEILNRETDEDHPLGTEQLLDRLAEFGINCHRITLYEDIKTLQKYGYEIFSVRAKSNQYYVTDRSLSVPEVLILMDAVQAAGFITEKKTAELVDKVAQLAGTQRGEVLKQNIVEFTTAKSVNESIYYSVSEIAQAIINKRKIKFFYFDYDENFQKAYRKKKSDPTQRRGYKVTPLGTVFDNGAYYLFCYDDFYKNVTHYRIDRMSEVKMLEEAATEGIAAEHFDLPTRKRQLFDMFGGEEATVEFLADRSLIDVIYDIFGGLVKVHTVDEGTIGFTANVQVSPTFLAWCCAFGNKLKVHSPTNVIEKIKAYVKSVEALYE